ncbi:hypothetical protein [Xenorhabdus griffiniae]|uniref:Uncharacterized protein n=1 Tax=Xenorhabdus griffiniae TaxID=351672 RepID=A0ABY9XKP4_9GAMM|nr:hypothetical protein [Xenorhabdus griffiniae]MBD1229232.1 hypothetical protein [Xenorhabdus griffiniae]MBE8588989.1 hypothetical protein [Xenorhabdus griffiniae]WMV73512.1 hypothetical protein QL128_05675 [Xenorhabdus griffiniae]WNH03192.1 hypothetical protein QL112_005680 [Xenorhabdus griffiniae]
MNVKNISQHPNELIGELYEENNRLRKQLLITRQSLISANSRLDAAQRELSLRNFDISCMPPISVSPQIRQWMDEYGVPWEALYCQICRSWFSDLDSAFPYHLEGCRCKCDEEQDQ